MKHLLLLLLLLLLFSPNIYAKAEWTILVYMAADNNLCNASFEDINEMESIPASDSVHFIVQVDPSDRITSPYSFTTARRFEITHDTNINQLSSKMIADIGEINSANPKEISQFANWGFATYPSKKRMLIIWDHGNGWSKDTEPVKYICDDHGNRISVADGELAEAISHITYPLDILAFDACLMQMPEIISEIAPYTKVFIASEETVPEDGFYYGNHIYPDVGFGNFIVQNPQATPREFAEKIVEDYINSYLGGYQSGSHLTLSAIDLSAYQKLIYALKDFCSMFSDTTYREELHTIRSKCFTIDYGQNVDIWDFFHRMESTANNDLAAAAKTLTTAIDSAVIAHAAVINKQSCPNIGRMALFFPIESERFINDWETYQKLCFVQQTHWDRFLDYYYNEDSTPPMITHFSAHQNNNHIFLRWEAHDPTICRYRITYKTVEDTTVQLLQDSLYISELQTSLPHNDYHFTLHAWDEFNNYATRDCYLSPHTSFVVAPNPYNNAEQSQIKFWFSTGNSTRATIFVYNFSGDFVDKIEVSVPKNSFTDIYYFPPTRLASGAYFCLLSTGNIHKIITLTIIR